MIDFKEELTSSYNSLKVLKHVILKYVDNNVNLSNKKQE